MGPADGTNFDNRWKRKALRAAMIETRCDGVSRLQFSHLATAPGVDHAVFTRHGGVSRPPYRSLNVGRGVGDEAAAVEENRSILSRCLNGARTVFLNQVHGTQVVRVGDDGAPDDAGAGCAGDAAMTDRPETALVIQTADCQAVLLFDPEQRVVANIHSGWRGSVADVIGKTVAAMVEAYGCRPEGMLAGIGPSLGPCCAEFRNYRSEIPEPLWGYGDHHRHFDFWALSRDQLAAAGVRKGNVETAGICTKCRSDRFFSYRAEGVTGRFAAAIALTEDDGQ